MFLEWLSNEQIAEIAKEYFVTYCSDSHNDDGSFITPESVERMDELVSITAPYTKKHVPTVEDKARAQEVLSNFKMGGRKYKCKSYTTRHFVYMTDFSIESNATKPDESEFYAGKMYSIFGDEWLEAYRKNVERDIEIMREIRLGFANADAGKINNEFDKRLEEAKVYFDDLEKLLKSNQEERE